MLNRTQEIDLLTTYLKYSLDKKPKDENISQDDLEELIKEALVSTGLVAHKDLALDPYSDLTVDIISLQNKLLESLGVEKTSKWVKSCSEVLSVLNFVQKENKKDKKIIRKEQQQHNDALDEKIGSLQKLSINEIITLAETSEYVREKVFAALCNPEVVLEIFYRSYQEDRKKLIDYCFHPESSCYQEIKNIALNTNSDAAYLCYMVITDNVKELDKEKAINAYISLKNIDTSLESFISFSEGIKQILGLMNTGNCISVISGTNLINCSGLKHIYPMAETKFTSSLMRNIDFNTNSLSNFTYSQCNLQNSSFAGVGIMRYVEFNACDLSACKFHEIQMIDVVITNSLLIGANFFKARLSSTDFSGSNLTDASFTNSPITAKQLLSAACIRNIKLDEEQLKSYSSGDYDKIMEKMVNDHQQFLDSTNDIQKITDDLLKIIADEKHTLKFISGIFSCDYGITVNYEKVIEAGRTRLAELISKSENLDEKLVNKLNIIINTDVHTSGSKAANYFSFYQPQSGADKLKLAIDSKKVVYKKIVLI